MTSHKYTHSGGQTVKNNTAEALKDLEPQMVDLDWSEGSPAQTEILRRPPWDLFLTTFNFWFWTHYKKATLLRNQFNTILGRV